MESHKDRRPARGAGRVHPEPQSHQGPKGRRRNADIQIGVREREREAIGPVIELVLGDRKPSCSQAMAQGGLCEPQPLWGSIRNPSTPRS